MDFFAYATRVIQAIQYLMEYPSVPILMNVKKIQIFVERINFVLISTEAICAIAIQVTKDRRESRNLLPVSILMSVNKVTG